MATHSSTKATEITQEFNLFPNLPPELRLRIWSTALQTPRTITITCTKQTTKVGDRSVQMLERFHSPNTPYPALLYTSRESRHEALAFYTRLFQNHDRILQPNAFEASLVVEQRKVDEASGVFLNLEWDEIDMSENTLPYVPDAELQVLRYMQVEITDAEYFAHYHMDTLRKCERLRELRLGVRRGVPNSWRGENHVFDVLIAEFQEVEELFPEWEVPVVEVRRIEDGVLVSKKVRRGLWVG